MTYLKAIGIFLIVFVVLYGIGFLFTGADYWMYKFWAPKQANVEREVFKNTQSFVDGKTSHLSMLRLDYKTAKGEQKAALKEMILTEAAQVDNNKLPLDLQLFIQQLRSE